MHGEVEADSEQLLLPAGEPGGELHRVGGGDLDIGIDKPALGGIGPTPRLEAGELATQPLRGQVGGDRLDLHGDVEASRVGGEWLEPAVADLSRVADDAKAATPAVTDPQRPRADLDGVGAERRGRAGGGVHDAGEEAAHRKPAFVAGVLGVRRARVTGASVPASP